MRLQNGSAAVALGTFKKAGGYTATVVYSGSDLAKAVSKSITFQVQPKH